GGPAETPLTRSRRASRPSGGLNTATGLSGSAPRGAGQVRCKTGSTLVDVLRDAASDASSILAASTSRPEPRADQVLPAIFLSCCAAREFEIKANQLKKRIEAILHHPKSRLCCCALSYSSLHCS